MGMVRRERRSRVGRSGHRVAHEVEEAWGKARRQNSMPRGLMITLVTLALGLLLAVVWVLVGSGKSGTSLRQAASDGSGEIRAGMESAEAVARAFLAETNPEKRLRWVRQADEVRNRMKGYPVAALSEPGEIDKVIGHNGTATAFAVTLPSGEVRLLEVVETPEELRVDWDAYARYGTTNWEDLWSGKAQQAVVRVFCEPSTEKPEPFADPARWTGFRMSSPDLPQVALAFARIGTVREAMMKKVVLGSPRYRQRFVLEVVRHAGMDEPLFEITECRAVGWIEGERPVEEVWTEEIPAAVE